MSNQTTDPKAYMNQQKRAYRKRHRTVSISYKVADAKRLEAEATKYKMQLSPYIRSCADAYRTQTFIVPDMAQVQAIEVQLKGIGTNINQIARRVNQGQTEPHEGIIQVGKQLTQLEQQFKRIIRTPWNLETYINQCLSTDLNIIPMLFCILTTHHNAHQKNIPQE